MFFEISILQPFCSVNLNRDDTNSIKTIDFGGYKRQRVSSQCWKNAVRKNEYFFTEINKDQGIRTKKIASEIFQQAGIQNIDEKISKNMGEFLKSIGMGELEAQKKSKKKGNDLSSDEEMSVEKLKTLFFTSKNEIKIAAEILKKHQFDPKISADEFNKERKKLPLSADISLFGRMAASDPKLNVDAAVQFAHAISTNEIYIEDDFFTALDDLANKEENSDAGASMMGSTQLASPCFYRYACISWEILMQNLNQNKELAIQTMEAFFKSFIYSVPSGKNNSTAPATVPEFILLSSSKKQPLSLVNAFIKPIHMGKNSKKSLIEESAESLVNYLQRHNEMYHWKKEREALCIHQLNKELEISDKLKSIGIATTNSDLNHSINLFLKDTAWSHK
ncbi:type I-E CRISPR-associated protein Cas7/Cse4/CasC [Silvanigrella paludirubra]|uniref:Type I-E CRISPR-associated protein Cas7/Cse4/CasC n=1 Tax=Silvanigrella paludirubra TaxID=2499159 RepID=A0A6N6VQD0_9BACT|nr:type I-E CRISPR-associated protein Cas7/Cse4/CasC [Silvanigrella paludirubra]KAB8037764.1 type I-E CRISPR-associated protein Cas7/Cse4/CasC [Silvanigrella paludirubra]